MLVQRNINDKIIEGNCKDILSTLPSDSIQLTITSPPYGNAIDYDIHASGNDRYYRGVTKIDTKDYLDELEEVFNDKLFRVSKEGSYCCHSNWE